MRSDVLRELHYSNNENLDDSMSDSPERRLISVTEFPSSPEEIKEANKRHKEKLAVEFNKKTQPIVKNLTRSIEQLKVTMKSTLNKTVDNFNA
jgi:hypothetical protein